MSVLETVRERLQAAGIPAAAQEASEIVAAVQAQGGDVTRALELAAQRATGTPLAYLVGKRRFMNVELYVESGALVPRDETELLGRAAVRLMREASAARAIDLCCGAGNLACAIAVELPTVTFWASDLTDDCARVSRENVRRLGLERRVHVHQGDLFASMADLGLEGTIDAIVCNPPYISTGRLGKDRAALLEHEPREAFDGGPFGLSIHQRVIRDALSFLKPGGWLLFEIGLGQHRQVETLFKRARAYGDVRMECDTEGNPRVVYARRTPGIESAAG